MKEFTLAGGNTPSRTLTNAGSGIEAPDGLALDSAGNLYVASKSGSVGRIGVCKRTSTTPAFTINAGMDGPWRLLLDGAGNLYVSNYSGANATAYKAPLSATSHVWKTFTAPTPGTPYSIAIDSSGNVYLGTRTTSDGVVKFDSNLTGTLISSGGLDVALDALGTSTYRGRKLPPVPSLLTPPGARVVRSARLRAASISRKASKSGLRIEKT